MTSARHLVLNDLGIIQINQMIKRAGLGVLIILLLVGCDSFLSVEDNPNAPDQERALSNPEDVESLIGSAYFSWYSSAEHQNPQLGLSLAADEFASPYGNFSMDRLGDQPRQAWPNDPSHGGRSFVENPWYGMYSALSSVNDGLIAMNGGVDLGEDQPRARAFARYVQGLSHGFLALMFDKAFVVDESVENLETAELEFQPYGQVMQAALTQLEEAVQISENNNFTLPDHWINGNPMSSDEFARLIRSYMARFTVQVARTPQERANVDWERVIQLIDQGIQEDFVIMGDGLGPQLWGFFNLKVLTQNDGWGRTDYMTIGPADQSGAFEDWMDTPVQERTTFTIETDDRRIAGTDSVTAPGKDFRYTSSIGGNYQTSNYKSHRYRETQQNGMEGPLVIMKKAEMDMLKAEALLRLGRDLDTVADLINKTRVDRGELSPAEASDGAGSWDDDQDPAPDASLWAKLKHEKRIETYATSTGVAFFDDRGWGDLVQDTPLHFPVPGQELQLLEEEIYTFGGGGEWSSDSGIH